MYLLHRREHLPMLSLLGLNHGPGQARDEEIHGEIESAGEFEDGKRYEDGKDHLILKMG